jgi:hypothetical protein
MAATVPAGSFLDPSALLELAVVEDEALDALADSTTLCGGGCETVVAG